MKKLNRLILLGLIIITSLAFTSCNPFGDFYLTLAVDLDFSTQGSYSDIFSDTQVCLSKFDDYNDNRDKLIEIKYVASAYMTISATQDLQGSNLQITLYQADRNTILFQFTKTQFAANDYKNAPLKIELTEQEKSNINDYLKDPQVDKCFYATFKLSNITPAQSYFLNGKIQFLTELEINP